MITTPQSQEILPWHIDRFVFYVRNPRKNDAVVDLVQPNVRGVLARAG
jgi:hypothetical protein